MVDFGIKKRSRNLRLCAEKTVWKLIFKMHVAFVTSRRSKRCPRMPKSTPRPPKRSQEGPRGAQEAPGSPQERPKRPQEASQSAPGASKRASRDPKSRSSCLSRCPPVFSEAPGPAAVFGRPQYCWDTSLTCKNYCTDSTSPMKTAPEGKSIFSEKLFMVIDFGKRGH